MNNILETLTKLERIPHETSFEFNTRVRDILRRQGFTLSCEVKVPDRGDGTIGRIDIIATKEGETYAVELDRVTPRKKSIFKITNYPCNYRLIVLRDKNCVYKY